ncbi:MAG: precorrin-6y C5,15-methyltransferase (decarboxylating) subunit CbiE [Pseudomonadota bacterium]
MAEAPWLTIVGIGEDGPDGLSEASRAAIADAQIVMGPPRHLALLPDVTAQTIPWPIPFADGIDQLLALRGRKAVMLASGDPFWFGAGSTLARRLDPGEWRSLPAPATFSLAANRLGWPLETTWTFGLHAASLTRIRPALATGARIIALLRDGAAVAPLARVLADARFGASRLWLLEALGGPRERITEATAETLPETAFQHPLCVAIEVAGRGDSLPLTSGMDDSWFDNDGQITKRPVRALTLSALAPRPGDQLWDIGAGSGSVAIEWLLAHPSLDATAIEADPERARRLRDNAARLGVDRLRVVEGRAPGALEGLIPPQAVFIGGGLDQALLDVLGDVLAAGTRVVANAVTLESEELLVAAHRRLGGDLMRVEIARAAPLGGRTGWKPAYPIVQWSHVL